MVAVYLYASGIPQYNQATWETGVEVESMLTWPNVEVQFGLSTGIFIYAQSTIAMLQGVQPTSDWPFHFTKSFAKELTTYTFSLNSSQLPPLDMALYGSSALLTFGVSVFCKFAMLKRTDFAY